jgi:membrane-bound serine protease (ClpP class)
MVLLYAVVAITPGFGVGGVSAILFLGGGVATAWYPDGPAAGIGSLVVAGAMTLAVLYFAPRTRAGKALVLKTAIVGQHTGDKDLAHLRGQTGVARTMLRPAGTAEIGGRRVDVVTDGEFIDAGTAIRVVQIEGARVVVARDA